MGERIRQFDWSQTPLGPLEAWPSALKTTTNLLLHSRHPMFLWWGPELIQIYNDAYVPSFGVGKHPAGARAAGRECWPEIWPIIGPQIDAVMLRGEPCWHEDALVPIFRNGALEEVYWTYGYSPVFDEDGASWARSWCARKPPARVRAVEREHAARKEARDRALAAAPLLRSSASRHLHLERHRLRGHFRQRALLPNGGARGPASADRSWTRFPRSRARASAISCSRCCGPARRSWVGRRGRCSSARPPAERPKTFISRSSTAPCGTSRASPRGSPCSPWTSANRWWRGARRKSSPGGYRRARPSFARSPSPSRNWRGRRGPTATSTGTIAAGTSIRAPPSNRCRAGAGAACTSLMSSRTWCAAGAARWRLGATSRWSFPCGAVTACFAGTSPARCPYATRVAASFAGSAPTPTSTTPSAPRPSATPCSPTRRASARAPKSPTAPKTSFWRPLRTSCAHRSTRFWAGRGCFAAANWTPADTCAGWRPSSATRAPRCA